MAIILEYRLKALLIVLIGLLACDSSRITNESSCLAENESDIPNLINNFLYESDTNCALIATKRLAYVLSKEVSNKYLWDFQVTDSASKEVEWAFIEMDDYYSELEDPHSLRLYVDTLGTIFFGSEVVDLHRIIHLYDSLLSVPDSICNCYREIITSSLGEMTIPVVGVQIDIQINKDVACYECCESLLTILKEAYAFRRLRLVKGSLLHFGREYSTLSYAQKSDLNEVCYWGLRVKFKLASNEKY